MLKQEWFNELEHVKHVDPDFYNTLERHFKHERIIIKEYAKRAQPRVTYEQAEADLRNAGLIFGQRVYIPLSKGKEFENNKPKEIVVERSLNVPEKLKGLDALTTISADIARDFCLHPALHITHPLSLYIDPQAVQIWTGMMRGAPTGYDRFKKDIESQKVPFTVLRVASTQNPYTITFTFGYKLADKHTQRIPLLQK